MSERRASAIQFRKSMEFENPWLGKCCWSCRHSDVTYHLNSIVCKRLERKVAYNNICNVYQANENNPYTRENQSITLDNASV